MTTLNTMIGAPSTKKVNWTQIKWRTVEQLVRRLQLRIAKAIKEGLTIQITKSIFAEDIL